MWPKGSHAKLLEGFDRCLKKLSSRHHDFNSCCAYFDCSKFGNTWRLTMNARKVTMIAAVLSFGLFTLEESALAQEGSALAQSQDFHCRKAKGNLVEVFNPGTNTNTGTLSNGGWLDGTTVAVFTGDGYPTPDPNKVTFSSTMTLTTGQGQLKGKRRVYLFDFVAGLGVTMTDIDPSASTGIFAGATGVLYINLLKSITVAQGPYYEVVGGQICFAREE
jgi:hypothetical protein